MVERTNQQEVGEVGRPAVTPPHDVMGLGEPTSAAPGELTLAIAVTNLTLHPRRGLTRQATESEHVAGLILDHGLDTSVTEQTPDRLGVHDRTILDLTPAGTRREAVELSVNDNRGAIRVGILGDSRRAERHEGISSAGTRVSAVLLTGHRRDVARQPLERASHDGTIGGRQLRFEPEPATLVEVPPGQRARTIDVHDLIQGDTHGQVTSVTYRCARHSRRPRDQVISVSGAAKRASSTTLSMPSSSLEKESDNRGNRSSASAAWIHRCAFQLETP